MKEITHEKLALWSYAYMHKTIKNGQPLSTEAEHEIALLCKGAIDPDNFMNFPQTGKKDIAINTIQSRIMFLERNDKCFYFLGKALHYLQDKWTLRPRIADKHTQWEQNIEEFATRQEGKTLEGEELEKPLIEFPNKHAAVYKLYCQLMIGSIMYYVVDKTEYNGLLAYSNDNWILNRKTQNKVFVNDFELFKSLEECLASLKISNRLFAPLHVELKVLSFANLGHPSGYNTPEIDYNFALSFSQNLAMYVLMPWEENSQSSPFMGFIHDRQRWFELSLLKNLLKTLIIWKEVCAQNTQIQRNTQDRLEFFLVPLKKTIIPSFGRSACFDEE